ncbi:hypothetical protein PQX77_001854 [Marasmius sp. AFHP31]|nr:hypothetical protein PQX77_001854 [Marasmius sp. AFHP31]
MGTLMAGAKYKGKYKEHIKSVLNEAEKATEDGGPGVILFIDELHLIMAGLGGEDGGMDAANLLKPLLAQGKLRCIGATTLTECRKYIKTDTALIQASHLAHGYLTSRRLPDAAIDLVNEAFACKTELEEMDKLQCKKLKLEIEIHDALGHEKDDASKERLKLTKKAITQVNDKLTPLKAVYENKEMKSTS